MPSQDSPHGPAPLPPGPVSAAPKLERSSEGDGLAPQGWQGPVSYRASRNLTKSLTVLLVEQEIGKELQLPCFSNFTMLPSKYGIFKELREDTFVNVSIPVIWHTCFF